MLTHPKTNKYASTICLSIASTSNSTKLQTIQNPAPHTATDYTFDTDIQQLHFETNILLHTHESSRITNETKIKTSHTNTSLFYKAKLISHIISKNICFEFRTNGFIFPRRITVKTDRILS